ncbi:type I restriction endonuclease subunit R [Candidatus Woesearchaeota archaeon]|nr:type I restriction endonuclease subunit R [Candidatus Woesearchaeota archaeon]
MPHIITEEEVENGVLDILRELGYTTIHGPDILPDGSSPERKSPEEVVLVERLRSALERINPKVPKDAIEEAIKKVLRTDSQNLTLNNKDFHKLLVDGVPVEYKKGSDVKHDTVDLFDFKNTKNNEFLAVNQFTIVEERNNRRPDIILFVNGLPLGVIELKNPADENATLWTAFNQFETYKQQIPSLFRFNEILVISDGLEARAGTITSNKERFIPWKTIDGDDPPKTMTQIEVLLKGMFEKARFMDIVRNFIVFETEKDKKTSTVRVSKKLAAYHQYHAVNKAVQSTVKATKGDKRAGIIWHTQGSGKSLVMVFYAGKLAVEDALSNPTIIVLTDRNDLDDQLFGTFSGCNDLLRQEPVQADSRNKVKELLKVASGGIVFTTIQKFMPELKGGQYPLLSNRRNIIVIADEAHRSQYDFIDGFAKHMRDALPNASFIGFTGTPIEKADKSTPAVFGKYVDIYDIQQAVEDGTTVRIYYEGRLAKLELKPEEVPKIDPGFEEVTEGEETAKKERLKSKWARLEVVVGSEKRIKRIAKDIIKHFETRLSVLEGKAMIVCMSRRICVALHDEIVKLRPAWYHKDDTKGFVKVIMTGSATDQLNWQEHIRNKPRRHDIGERMKDPSDPLKLAIVRDMWLTGFDAPSLHTMYLDKPMRGHGLMQAIARVNRVFSNKPGGLIVDYIGVAYELKKALAEYTEGDKRQTGIPQEDAVALMQEKYEIVQGIFHGFNYKRFFEVKPTDKMSIMKQAIEHVLKQQNGKERYLKSVTELSKAFALAVPHEDALEIRDNVGFFQAVRASIAKNTETKESQPEDIDSAIQQIVSKAIVSDRVIDIFAAAGLKKPDVAILSEEFLSEVKGMPQKNLAFEMLRKLLNNEIKFRSKKNLIQARSFAEMLEKAIKSYTNKSIETAQVIEELIDLAREMREAAKDGKKLGLTEAETAFYDALEVNDSAVKILGDDILKKIARELVEMIRKNVTIDWTIRENVQANLRVMIKKILRKYGYPPDKQQRATDTVLEQAKLLCGDIAQCL